MAPPESGVSCAIKRRLDGGLDSEVNGKRGQDIYFMGIIDILQVSQLRGQLHYLSENECMGYVSQFYCCVCTPGWGVVSRPPSWASSRCRRPVAPHLR